MPVYMQQYAYRAGQKRKEKKGQKWKKKWTHQNKQYVRFNFEKRLAMRKRKKNKDNRSFRFCSVSHKTRGGFLHNSVVRVIHQHLLVCIEEVF